MMRNHGTSMLVLKILGPERQTKEIEMTLEAKEDLDVIYLMDVTIGKFHSHENSSFPT